MSLIITNTIYSPSIITDGLVVWLDAANKKSYDGTGSVWYDLSDQHNDFSIYGSPTFHDTYFKLDGSITQYVQLSPFPHPTANYTIELWERIDVFNNTPFYSYAVTSDSNEGLLYAPGGQIRVYGPAGYDVSSYTLEADKWVQIVRSRTAANGSEKIYINGQLIFHTTLASGSATISNGSFNVGQEQDTPGGNFHPGQTLNGDISMIRVYNRNLSDNEVLKNFAAFRGRYQ